MDGASRVVDHGDGCGKQRKSVALENIAMDLSNALATCSQNPQGSPCQDNLLQKKAKKTVGRFFYETGLDYIAIESPSFQNMMSCFTGPCKYQLPTSQELKGWILVDAVNEMHEYLNEVQSSWANTGCSVLLDDWTDGQRRNLVNILVDCPRGAVYLRSEDISNCIGDKNAMLSFLEKVITEVGIDNVVQIMTCSTSAFMKEVGKELTEKYRSIYCTFSAPCCMELMLEKLCRMNLIKETLEQAKNITRFIYANPDALKFIQERTNGGELIKRSKVQFTQSFLTLENMVLEKETLKAMFESTETLTSTEEGKQAAKLVADWSFWNDATAVLKVATPLVHAIQWFNASTQEQMGYLYKTMDEAKKTIKDGFTWRSQYMHFWKVIDDVRSDFLHSPLHSAGYFLNPIVYFSEDPDVIPEVAAGMCCCIVRSTTDTQIQDRMVIQMENYRRGWGPFSVGRTVDARANVSPAQWWHKYGAGYPELQRLAIRVLSQTCDGAAKFQLRRSLVEGLLSEGRNSEEQKRLSKLVFLRYNIQLQNFATGKMGYIVPDAMNTMDDWTIASKIQGGTSKNRDASTTCMELVAN